MIRAVEVPELVRDPSHLVVASVSGGKDSTALLLVLKELEIPFRAVFADTGWEAPETYDYLEFLRSKIGPIEVVRPRRDMVASIRQRAGFPGRMQRWCTRELKLEPLREFHDQLSQGGVETISAMGVRAEESEARSKMSEWVDDDEWGGWIWRPLLKWTTEDVLLTHRKHGIPVNPLYRAGFDRVGCFPCIFARKEEIRLLPEWRVEEIEKLERDAKATRAERNSEKPGRYSHDEATFFQTRKKNSEPMNIRQIVEWSRTDHGGKSTPILAPAPRGGCMRWGLCETGPIEPSTDEGGAQ